MSNQAINGVRIPTLQVQKPVSFQQNQIPTMQGTTSMQGVDAETLKQSANNSYIANRARASEESNPLAVAGLGAGVWYGISQGMDKLNPKMAGDYNKSLLGKLGAFGDKISKDTYLGRKFETFANWLDTKVTKLAGKSKIVYSLQNHSTKPEWNFAKMPGEGLHGFLSADASTVIEEFMKPASTNQAHSILGIKVSPDVVGFQKLEQYGMSQKDIDNFAKALKGKSYQTKAIAIQAKELDLLGADSKVVQKILKRRGLRGLQEYAKHKKVQLLGFKNLKEFEALSSKFLENPDKVLKMFDNVAQKHPNFKISIWRDKGSLFGKIKSHLLGRTVSFSEYRNKYMATLGKGNSTKLGRFLPKAFGWFTEGCTNRFAGGKVAVAMQAGIFADMLYQTIKAPKNEKIKTFAERFVNDFTYFLALTAGIMGMHKIGGFKYAGLDVKGREAYRKALTKFNNKVKAGAYKNKKAYKSAEKALDSMLGTKNIKNPITKILNKIGRFINMGNERVLPYQSTSKMNMNLLRKMGNANVLGVPMRIAIPLMIVSPFLAKLTTKAAHAIFGRPTKSVLDEEVEPQENEKLAQEMMNGQGTQNNNPYQNTIPAINKRPEDYKSDTNLIKRTINGNTQSELDTQPDKEPVRTYIPSPECMVKPSSEDLKKKKVEEPTRTYIPSPVGMVQKTPDMTAADKAFADADVAEKYINETLASLRQQ